MKCPECNYVSFDGLKNCKRCGHLFTRKGVSGVGQDITSGPDQDSGKSPGDDILRLQQTVDSIRKSLNVIDGPRDDERTVPAHRTPMEITTDELNLRVDGDYMERSRGFPDHTDINWEESLPLSSDELQLGPQGEPDPGGDGQSDPVHPGVPFTESAEFKNELRRVGERLRQLEDTPGKTGLEELPVISDGIPLSSVKKGGFWIRFAALVIDNLILYLVALSLAVLGVFAMGLGSSGLESLDEEGMLSLIVPLYLFDTLITIFYYTYFHGSTGQTPGKMICRLRVVRPDGRPLGYGRAFLRWVGYIVSSFAFCLGFLWVAWDRNKQGWHDKIAGSFVIRI